MAPEKGQAPCLLELSSLEVEPLEVIIHPPESEQDSRLDTLTTPSGDLDVAAFLTGTLPVNGKCCCCCCISCCCYGCC